MVYIAALPGVQVDLGQQGENLARTIRFDISEWQTIYGEGEVILLAEPGRGGAVYPCVVTVTDKTVEWPITAYDTAVVSKSGKYEIQYRVNDVVVKSAVGNTVVHESLGSASSEAPSPVPSWVEQVLEAADRITSGGGQAGSGGGSSGTLDHNELSNRSAVDQHPISAITGLTEELMLKQPLGNYLTRMDLEDELEKLGEKQDVIKGTPGQFVVIGDDGTMTTMSLTNVSEVGA